MPGPESTPPCSWKNSLSYMDTYLVAPNSPTQNRIGLLDVLRALALLGIVIVHAHDHFNIYELNFITEGWQTTANVLVDWCYTHLFVGKAFLIFSFLFGLSFFIQLDRNEQKGIDFRNRFIWRLVLLCGFGVLHSCFYDGDILLIFGILGLFIVPLFRCSSRSLIILALICFLQPVAIYDTLVQQGILLDWPISASWPIYVTNYTGPGRDEVYMTGTWWEVARFNLYIGFWGKWHYILTSSGRLWQTLGLFIVGLLVGRSRYFENTAHHLKLTKKLFVYGIVSHLVLITLATHYPATQRFLQCWGNLAFGTGFVAGVVLVFHYCKLTHLSGLLCAVGKCTLSCYVAQSIIFTSLFFGWGFGLAAYVAPWLCIVLALCVFFIQAVVAKYWLKHFYYGPLEWLWRSATMLKWQKMHKLSA